MFASYEDTQQQQHDDDDKDNAVVDENGIYIDKDNVSTAMKNDHSSKEEIETQSKSTTVSNHPIIDNDNDDTINQTKVSSDDYKQERKLERIMRFLLHPKISSLSPIMKESYLQSKGVSNDDINIVMKRIQQQHEQMNESGDYDGEKMKPKMNVSQDNFVEHVWEDCQQEPYSKQRHHQQQQQQQQQQQYFHPSQDYDHNYPYFPEYSLSHHNPQQQPHPLPELPNPLVPMTLGGALTLFGFATFRWLNGEDFAFFPPTTTQSSSIRSNDDNLQDEIVTDNDCDDNNPLEQQYYENGDDHIMLDNSNDDDVDIARNFNSNNPNIEELLNHKNNHTISNDIRNLTLAIEKYTALQEKSIKDKSDERAKSTTDSAMDLLRNHDNNDNNDNNIMNGSKSKFSDNGIDTQRQKDIDLAVLIQIIEFKCAIKTLGDRLGNKTLESSSDLDEIKCQLDNILKHVKSIEAKLSPSTAIQTDKNDKNEEERNCAKENKEIGEDGEKEKISIVDKDSVTSPNADRNKCQQPNQTDDSNLMTNDTQNIQENNQDKAPSVGLVPLKIALRNMQKTNDPNVMKSCVQMLILYTTNLSANPSSNQYRKIYTNSKTYIDKVEKVEFAKDVLLAVGFVDEGKTFLEWSNRNDDDEDAAIKLLKEAVLLLKQVKNGEEINV